VDSKDVEKAQFILVNAHFICSITLSAVYGKFSDVDFSQPPTMSAKQFLTLRHNSYNNGTLPFESTSFHSLLPFLLPSPFTTGHSQILVYLSLLTVGIKATNLRDQGVPYPQAKIILQQL